MSTLPASASQRAAYRRFIEPTVERRSGLAGDRQAHLRADGEELFADRVEHQLLDLVLDLRTTDGDRLRAHHAGRDLEVTAHHEARAMRDRIHRVTPLGEVDLGGRLDELLHH